LKVVNDTAVAVNQGGKRKGAVCAYLETWHMDIEEFIELRKNTGDDRRRTHDMNTANWIPDLFMKRVFDDGPWTLFSPSEVPDLHDLTGKAFEERYEYYEALSQYPGKIKLFKTIQAKDLWRKMLSMLFETGHPWLTFKDPCNLRSPQQHVGVVHSSNLCTEITLNTNKDEIAVCNLGSINLPNHIKDGKLDTDKLKRTIDVAVRMLDNVIDINYYSVPQARNSNFKHRPVGLGIMGFQDALYLQHIPYASQAAVEFADKSMEAVSYYAIQASCDLADERGAYETFQGSLWS
ncbi:ribonucleoside-diphosphate reductase subunit alpha, partial [Pseudomonas fragi]|nr:ribonucleoside-diphosphate reductase subunit alpha [Pseudomonas sp. GC01]